MRHRTPKLTRRVFSHRSSLSPLMTSEDALTEHGKQLSPAPKPSAPLNALQSPPLVPDPPPPAQDPWPAVWRPPGVSLLLWSEHLPLVPTRTEAAVKSDTEMRRAEGSAQTAATSAIRRLMMACRRTTDTMGTRQDAGGPKSDPSQEGGRRSLPFDWSRRAPFSSPSHLVLFIVSKAVLVIHVSV